MSNNIGQRVANIEADNPWLPITQVKVNADDRHTYTAGTTTGRTFEVDCPIGSQAVADNLLSALNGYVYKAYEARDALIKPNIELGQSVSVGDVYSIVGGIVLKGDMILAADLSAPSSGELDHEYPYDQWKKVVVDAKNIRHGGGHGTVSGAAITPETIGETQVASNAITNLKIAAAAISARCLAASAVTEDAIADNAVSADKIDIPDLLQSIKALNIEAQLITADVQLIAPLANITYITCGALQFDGNAVSWQSKTVVTNVTSYHTVSRKWMYEDAQGNPQTQTTTMVTSVSDTTDTIYYLGKA